MSVHYERLSHLDKSFLALETRALHFHVGAIAIFDAGSFAKDDGGIDIERGTPNDSDANETEYFINVGGRYDF